ncbi:a0d7f97e-2980-4e9b-988c-44b7c2bc0275 [Sclerotinia trifoliorum]|uniref:DNA helicase n=1 Tax=Sclerotinia trifoliorum TaxID=28548 RepID=A0A8H2ZQR1_9HELO|nr:a0d7f97e-2980-4e9b-988c-44b7c2bc0275 [Sclerotinia trifoliorum]
MTTASEAPESEKIFDIPPSEDVPQTPKANRHAIENGDGEAPPSKRRRLSNETKTIPKRKPESPPWKKVLAEGPTSFTVDGKRKSGRVNQIPLELQPPSEKRTTRGAAQKAVTSKSQHGNASSIHLSLNRDASTAAASQASKKSVSQSTSRSPAKPSTSPKRSHRKTIPLEHHSTQVRPGNKKSIATKDPQSTPTNARLRRSGRASEVMQNDLTNSSPAVQSEGMADETPKSTPTKIRLRVKPAGIPMIHPNALPKPRKFESFEEFYEQGQHISVEKGGLYSAEDAEVFTEEDAKREAHTILQLEDAVERGVLGYSLNRPEKQDPMPPQYAHQDHLVKAALHFRTLMIREQKEHLRLAKQLAEACRDEWIRRQPKSHEQLEAEERKASEVRYKSVLKSLLGTWENVKIEVNRRRLVEWEAQEQARVRKALNEAVDISTQKLQARRAQQDSENDTEEDDDEDEEANDDSDNDNDSDSELNDDESNMSSTESEADEETTKHEDEQLTVDELREKYAALPEIAPASDDNEMIGNGSADEDMESDPSIDMDDDTDSSDEEEDSDEEGGNDADEGGRADLLGFLLPSDIKDLETRQAELGQVEELVQVMDEDSTPAIADDAMGLDAHDGETSNIPNGASVPPLMNGTSKKSALIEDISSSDQHDLSSKPEVIAISPDRSSQPTPRTTETKPSEADSASSVDLHHSSRRNTQSVTPQPSNGLKTPVPFLLRGTLREYQHYGLDWLAGLYANNTNGILADEMGLGKTIQTIALLAHLACEHEVWGPHLVIVPTSVMLNWEMEFKKWCPGFKILTYYGNQEERKRKRAGWKDDDSWNVCITSYQLVIQDQQVFKRRQWHYMILDEAHNIKNFQSQRWQTMLNFNTRARLLLTGTPLQNNLTELWSLLYFLMPSDGSEQGVGGFANLKEFQDWFKKPTEQILEHGREQMDDESKAIISKLHKVLRPYLLRRLKVDVEKQMPGKYEHVEFCRLSKRQRELYDSFLSRNDTRDTLASGNYLSIINCLMQLRKVCNHPDLFLDRPIMTSFPMEKSAITDFEIKELLVRRKMFRQEPMTEVSLDFLNLVPAKHESLSGILASEINRLSARRALEVMREAQRTRAQNAFTNLDPSTVKSNLVYLESASRWGRFEELQHCVYLNALRRQQKPIYGSSLIERLDLRLDQRPLQAKPKRRTKLIEWLEDSSPVMSSMVPTFTSRSQELHTTIQKFACVTPPVVARDMNSVIFTPKGVSTFQSTVGTQKTDPFHEARMRLSIQFPDKRLLQYDCGKLQTLDKLLRKLQAGGHRALIFTQMTKVLDILEQFLNIHGHKYLRLDGATKIEQRQILTDRFNNDTRILAFILSSRSGGLGINLTGADTVIFYDLDWNPAMDKQCQDRCHRIGQTRDVHIYRLVSEHTIEANILRKANQKRMLDDVVIQEGEFTTDYFNKMNVRDVIGEEGPSLMDGDAAANAAMDRVLGGPDNDKDVRRVFAQAEDREDVAAARVAEREIVQTDAADFDENAVSASATPGGAGTPAESAPTPGADGTPTVEDLMEIYEDELDAWGQPVGSTDDYMLKFMSAQLANAPIELPRDKKKGKKGKDHRNRHRAR